MPQRWIIDHVKEKPPRCLGKLAVDWRSDAAKAVLVGAEVPHSRAVTFALGLRGYAERPTLMGHYLDRDWPDYCAPHVSGRIFVSPLFLRWGTSGPLVPVFDHRTDGYNAEIGWPHGHEVSSNPLAEWVPPPECLWPVYVVWLAYAICDDEELPSEMRERPEDFFDAFALAVYCQDSGRVWNVTDFECA
jgi:hypothetical protein